MSKPNFQRTVTSRVMASAPHLKFIALYHTDETSINACMLGYRGRAFVYVLTADYNGTETYLYVGKSQAQYERFLGHLRRFAFDHIYLFECEPKHLAESESAVIRELTPLFNRQHNPLAERNKRILGIDNTTPKDATITQRYLQLQDAYAPVGLYGFSLPLAVFAVLQNKAYVEHCKCSEMLQRILENAFSAEIADALHNSQHAEEQTNLVTTQAYANLHGRSREQVKQYCKQKNRIPGAMHVGRDWVLLKDATFPMDRRRKVSK